MKKPFLLLFVFCNLIFFQRALAQKQKPAGQEKVFAVAEKMPVFPGGETALKDYFKNALAAKNPTKGGIITLTMVIDKTGKPTDIETGTGISPETNAMVLEIARKMPKWQPASQNGKPVNVRMNIPVVVHTAEQQREAEKEDNQVYQFVEQQPEFPGGENGWHKYLKTNMKYPADAFENKIEGMVIVNFLVTKTGKTKEAKVIKGLLPSIDAEALRLIKNMPDMKPGKQNGRNVIVSVNYPIRFKLEEPAEKK